MVLLSPTYFFMDDYLLFTHAKASQVCLVNLENSRFMASNNTSQTKRAKFATLASIQPIISISNYLGFPLIQGRVTKEIFNPIIEKMHSPLARWKSC